MKHIYTHAIEEQVWPVEFRQSHHKFDLPIELIMHTLKVLAEGCIYQF